MAITKTQIKKWNEEFNSLSKPEKRVAIAKDVIKQVKAGKYYPSNWYGYIDFEKVVDENLSIQENFDKIKNCSCCMLGACLLSITKFQNQLKFKDTYDEEKLDTGFQGNNSKITKLLSSVFTPKQQALLEACFENGNYEHAKNAFKISLSPDEVIDCFEFFEKYEHPDERVIAAMENIIKNKGNFIL